MIKFRATQYWPNADSFMQSAQVCLGQTFTDRGDIRDQLEADVAITRAVLCRIGWHPADAVTLDRYCYSTNI